MTPIQEVYEEIAEEFGVNKYQVQDCISSQLELVAQQMEKDTFRAVRLPYLGVFKCKPGRLKQLKINTDE